METVAADGLFYFFIDNDIDLDTSFGSSFQDLIQSVLLIVIGGSS